MNTAMFENQGFSVFWW